ncbi:MAG: hypothetical protein RMJ84_13820, partial [Sandaracinaceae bacterium]|nr:hypothetical protein [Sandaracinaceae bacterium]
LLDTRITIRASAGSRELRFREVLPKPALPVDFRSELPATLSPSGLLVLSLRPGTHVIDIESVIFEPELKLEVPKPGEGWPEQEVWAWVPDSTYREAKIEGVPSIDPKQSTLPPEWQGSAAYLVHQGAELMLQTVRRGQANAPPPAVEVERTMWLGFKGTEFFVRDEVRLNAWPEQHRLELMQGELGRVHSSKKDRDLLITKTSGEGRPGIEVRDLDDRYLAEWRLEVNKGKIPAVNWSENASSLSIALNLPPGWMLFSAEGVDEVRGGWLEEWRLFDLFVLLLISFAFWRLLGWRSGLLALLAMGLSFHAELAPRWSWLVLVTTVAIANATRGRRYEKLWKGLAYTIGVVVALLVLAFATKEIKGAIFPILDRPFELLMPEGFVPPKLLSSEEIPAAASGFEGAARVAEDSYGIEAEEKGFGEKLKETREGTVTQTGFGMPTWEWKRHELRYVGPVSREREIRIWLVSPWLFQLIAFARGGLVVLLLLVLFSKLRSKEEQKSSAQRDAKAAAISVFWMVLAWKPHAMAQEIPTESMLSALRERVTRPVPCGDRCVESHRMEIRIRESTLQIRIFVSASRLMAFPLPGPSDRWVPSIVRLDGSPSQALIRLENSHLFIRLPPGSHTIEAEGEVRVGQAWTLGLGQAPRTLLILHAEGWEVSKSEKEGGGVESLQFVPVQKGVQEQLTPSPLPAYFMVTRTLSLGWRWISQTTVRRQSPPRGPAVLSVPLLPEERVLDARFPIVGNS